MDWLMLRWLKVSDAAAKIAISLTPAFWARSSPARLGTRAVYRTPSRRSMPANTSAASAICGTHRGLTKAETSIVECPAAASALTNAIFTVVGTCVASFCSPSRGPHSTRRTESGMFTLLSSRFSVRVQVRFRVRRSAFRIQRSAFRIQRSGFVPKFEERDSGLDEFTDAAIDGGHASVGRRADR